VSGLAEVDWRSGRWLNEPEESRVSSGDLVVTARSGSDFWQVTGYGFVHNNGHGLLRDLPIGRAMEVSFIADFAELYDHAGLLVWADEHTWVKAGIEFSDGLPQLSAVVTKDVSDWSVYPVPHWSGTEVTLRASRGEDAVTVRARAAGAGWQLVRLAPFVAPGTVAAGPMVCAPSRAGLKVRFTGWRAGPADASVHEG
jgi:regulation of enolase protein 1 (concanavalin A-like superfamily)